MQSSTAGLILLAAALAVSTGYGAAEPGLVTGKAYFEYTYPLESDSGFTQFHFTRFYFTYETKISKRHTVRFRLDGDEKVDGKKWRPYLKQAYVSWQDIIPHAQAIFGMQETPNCSYSEKFWGYRSVEKTIMDKNKITSSADVGIGIKGELPFKFAYHLLYANGTGYAEPEDDNSKKGYGLLALTPLKAITLSAFYDYEARASANIYATYGAFGGLNLKWIKLGGEYFNRKVGGVNTTTTTTGISAYGKLSWKIKGYLGNVIARVDIYDPNAAILYDEETYALICYDFVADKNFHIIPNARRTWIGSDPPIDTIYINFEFKY